MALIIALVFLYRFKLAIEGLLARVTEGEILGQKIKAAAPSQSLESTNAGDYLTKMVEAHQQADGHPADMAAEPLPAELADEPDAQKAIKWVKDNPVQTVLEYKKLMLDLNFERIFNRIYGTQIALLDFLATRPTDAVPITQLAKFHMEHLSKVTSSQYQQQDYMNFLVINGVMKVVPLVDQLGYSITPYGIQFLAYIKAAYPLGWFQRLY